GVEVLRLRRPEVPSRLRIDLGVVEHLVRLLLDRHPAEQVVDPGRDRLVPVLVRLDGAVLVEVAAAVDDGDAVGDGGDLGEVEAERTDYGGGGRARPADRDDVPLVGPAVGDVPGRRVAGTGRLSHLGVQVDQAAGGGEVVVGTADVDPDLVVDGSRDARPG